MANINFKGKEIVRNHHLTIPYHELVPDAKKGLSKKPSLNDNLIIHGDNLLALKALLPTYAGKVKCIYIDPPYNTGNEKWAYNDNVNSPMMLQWLKEKVVDKDDLTRHDKWLCMMMPRLKLLRELLTDDGIIFVSIDDNEQHHLRQIMDDVFGEDKTDVLIWRKSGDDRYGKMKNTETFRKDHEYVLVGYKNAIGLNKIIEKPNFKNEYLNLDNDPRGPYKAGSISRREEASDRHHENYYLVVSPSGKKFTRQFDIPKTEFEALNKDKKIYWGKIGDAVPAIKIFLNENREITPYSVLQNQGSTYSGKIELREIFGIDEGEEDLFPNPKPSILIKTLIQLATDKNSIILDSFAGSGTTAHATLALNSTGLIDVEYVLPGSLCTSIFKGIFPFKNGLCPFFPISAFYDFLFSAAAGCSSAFSISIATTRHSVPYMPAVSQAAIFSTSVLSFSPSA